MKVVFVFTGFLKFKGRLLKQIDTLQTAGHECILIHGQVETPPPDYRDYSFEVRPVPVVRHPNKVLNYYNHIRFNVQAADEVRRLNPGAVVCVELYGALSGALARHRNPKLHFIYDNNELFMQMGMGRIKKLIWAPIHAWIFRKADTILHAEEQRLLFCQKHYRSRAKHFLLENLPGSLREDSPPELREATFPLRLVYVGALLPDRCCEEVIEAFNSIPPETASLDFIGFGAPEYEAELKEMLVERKLKQVRILPPVTHSKMARVLEQYDAGLAFYENLNLNQYYCAPNKVYDYIAAGMPVISNNYPGLHHVLEDNRIGVCLDRVSAPDLLEAFEKIVRGNLRANITPEIKKRYSWDYQASGYCALFEG